MPAEGKIRITVSAHIITFPVCVLVVVVVVVLKMRKTRIVAESVQV